MSKKFIHIVPWSSDKNLSRFYNRMVMKLKSDDSWVLFTDRDTYFPHPQYGKHLEAIINRHGDKFDLFTCMTNRVGTDYQCVRGLWGEENGGVIEQRAKSLWLAQGVAVDDITDRTPISGMMMLVRKSLLTKGRELKDGLLLGADNEFHYIAQESGKRVGLMKGVLIYHYYRDGKRDNKAHLK